MKKSTLINIEFELLLEFKKWEMANPNNWTIGSYLNNFYDINTALAFSKLYFPPRTLPNKN